MSCGGLGGCSDIYIRYICGDGDRWYGFCGRYPQSYRTCGDGDRWYGFCGRYPQSYRTCGKKVKRSESNCC